MTDQNNNDITPASSTGPFSVAGAFTLLCYPSGTGTDTYPADIQQNLPGVDFLNPYGAPYYFDNTASSNPSPFSGYYSDTENNNNGYPFYNNGSAWETINGTKTSTTTSSLICQFHYQGTGTPPAYLNILETSSAGVSASVSCASNAPPSSELSASASASDGLGDTASQSADASTFSNFYSPTPSQTTKQLVEVPVLKGIATVSIPTNVSITEVDTAPYWGAGNTGYGATDTQVTAMVSAEANLDSRAVSISCPSIEPNYYKALPLPGTTTPQCLERIPASGTWAMTADSVVTWQNGYDASGMPNGLPQGWVVNSLPFTAIATNFQNPYYNWSVTGAGNLAGPTHGFNDIAYPVNPCLFSLYNATVTGFPETSQITASVTDTDGAVGTNTFDVTWHLPQEAYGSPVVTTGSSIFATRIVGIPSGLTESIPASPKQDVSLDGLINNVSVLAGLTGNEEITGGMQILGAVSGIVEWIHTFNAEPIATEGGTNGPITWQAATTDDTEFGSQTTPSTFVQHIPQNYYGQSNGWEHCTMNIDRVQYTTKKVWQADDYNESGFQDANGVLVTSVITSDHDEPVFKPTLY